jgi:20S proteasome subunit beta 2
VLPSVCQLVKDAIHAGIFNDLGSGSNVDITIVPLKGPANIMRGYDTPNEQADLRGNYTRPKSRIIPPGATAVLETKFEPLEKRVTIETVPEGTMDM